MAQARLTLDSWAGERPALCQYASPGRFDALKTGYLSVNAPSAGGISLSGGLVACRQQSSAHACMPSSLCSHRCVPVTPAQCEYRYSVLDDEMSCEIGILQSITSYTSERLP